MGLDPVWGKKNATDRRTAGQLLTRTGRVIRTVADAGYSETD